MSLLNFTFYDWLLAHDNLPLGKGLFCTMHIILMVLLFTWVVVSYLIFVKYKTFALKFTTFLCWFMVISRLFRMILLAATKTNTVVEVLPWHLCHLMSFVFPLFYLTKTKKCFLPVLLCTFFGGILTFMFGDYYHFAFFTFLDIESILLHFMMVSVVTACVATGYFKLQLKEFWQAPIGLLLIVANASLGNYLCPGQNYLFLKENGLPFKLFPGHSFMYTYFILILVITIIVLVPVLVFDLKSRKKGCTRNGKYKYEVIG